MQTENQVRQYVPAVNTLITLRIWDDYARLRTTGGHPEVAIWGRFRVSAIVNGYVLASYSPSPLDPSQDTGEFSLPLEAIQSPIGWKAQYTISCKPDEVEKVFSWFARGIRVKVDHAMDRLAGNCFTPLDTNPSIAPSGGYGLTDEILPEDCPKVFSVVAYVEHEISMPKDSYIRRQYQKACRASGWKLWNRDYGAHGYPWYRAKELTLFRAGQGDSPEKAFELYKILLPMGELDPPKLPSDILDALGKDFPHDSETERQAIAQGLAIPRWVLYRAGMHLDGRPMEYSGHASTTRAGNSTWMYDPESTGDPVKRS